jgi:hypothetical protein
MWTLGDFEMDYEQWRRVDSFGGRLGCREWSFGDFEMDQGIRKRLDMRPN